MARTDWSVEIRPCAMARLPAQAAAPPFPGLRPHPGARLNPQGRESDGPRCVCGPLRRSSSRKKAPRGWLRGGRQTGGQRRGGRVPGLSWRRPPLGTALAARGSSTEISAAQATACGIESCATLPAARRRRTKPPSPTSPVASNASDPGSGVAVVATFPNSNIKSL